MPRVTNTSSTAPAGSVGSATANMHLANDGNNCMQANCLRDMHRGGPRMGQRCRGKGTKANKTRSMNQQMRRTQACRTCQLAASRSSPSGRGVVTEVARNSVFVNFLTYFHCTDGPAALAACWTRAKRVVGCPSSPTRSSNANRQKKAKAKHHEQYLPPENSKLLPQQWLPDTHHLDPTTKRPPPALRPRRDRR